MIAGLNLRLLGMALGALAVVGFVWMALSWKQQRDDLRAWRGDVVAATRSAAGNPRLASEAVPQQVELLGRAIADLKGAIGRQNDAVAELGARSAQLQDEAAKASRSASQRVSRVEGARDRLEASSRTGGAERACVPSKALEEAWR
jgi:hypothetical protein